MKQAWEKLADDVITDEEAGQQGAKSSKLFQLICQKTFVDYDETVRLLKKIKEL